MTVPAGSNITHTDISGADTVDPSFVPDTAGTYVLELMVSDGRDLGFDNVAVTVEEALQNPVAELGGPYSGTAGTPVTFDASGSHDPDGTIVSYEWDWNGDGEYDELTTSPTVSHAWGSAFCGNVNLIITDDDGLTATDSAQIDITAQSFRISGGAYFYPETPTYKASFSMDITGPLPAGWLKYYYGRIRISLVSTQITTVSLSGDTVTILGIGSVNGVAGYTFTATATNGTPHRFSIAIRKPDGSTHYTAGPLNTSGGDLVLQ